MIIVGKDTSQLERKQKYRLIIAQNVLNFMVNAVHIRFLLQLS